MNKVILVGRLVKDPELKQTPNNISYVQFVVAINRPFANKDGDKQADFISCVAWRQQAENLAKYMSKGKLVGIDGRIQTRNFEDSSGTRQYVTEVLCDSIQFLEAKSKSDSSRENDYQPKVTEEKKEQKDPFENIKNDFNISEDDLPF